MYGATDLSIEELKKMCEESFEKAEELKELKKLADNVPDYICENIGWELPSNSPEYKKR